MFTMEQENNKEVPIKPIVDGTKNLIYVRLQKSPDEGFGFNIVGGKDKQHLAGHSDIFVTVVRPDTPASNDNLFEPGDIIVSINGVDLSGMNHEEAIQLFRSAPDVCDIVVEKGGEQRILSDPVDFPDGTPASSKVKQMTRKFFLDQSGGPKSDKPSSPASRDADNFLSDDEKFFTPLNSPGSAKFSTRHQLLRNNKGLFKDQGSSNSSSKVESEQKNVNRALSFSSDDQEKISAVAHLPSRVLGEETNGVWLCKDEIEVVKEISVNSNEIDKQSSATSSTSFSGVDHHSFDDLHSPSLKKQSPLNYLKRTSSDNEILFVLIGIAALGATAFIAYRWYKKH